LLIECFDHYATELNTSYSIIFPGQWNVWDTAYKTILEAQSNSPKAPPQEAVQYCMRACYFSLLWDLHHCEELAQSGAGTAVEDAVAETKGRLLRFMDSMEEMLKLEHCEEYKEEVCKRNCIMFM
jgi:hypothetical protein